MIYNEKHAIDQVRNYVEHHLDKSDDKVNFDVYVVWKCKILQHSKYLISTTLPDGMYYEVTFNGDKNEVYLDAYKKFDNQCISVIFDDDQPEITPLNDQIYDEKIKKLQTLLEEIKS